jgi:hypothetical protein
LYFVQLRIAVFAFIVKRFRVFDAPLMMMVMMMMMA